MTDKLCLITEAQRQNLVLKEREHKDAIEMLQSLPVVTILVAVTGWGVITFISYLLSFVQLAPNT